MFLLVSRSLDHDKNETETAFDTRLIAVTPEASMDDWTTSAPQNYGCYHGWLWSNPCQFPRVPGDEEIDGDIITFETGRSFGYGYVHGDVNDDGPGHAITPFLGGELQGGLGSCGPIILIGNTKTSSTCLHVDMQRGSKMQLHIPEESVHGKTSCECIHTVRQR